LLQTPEVNGFGQSVAAVSCLHTIEQYAFEPPMKQALLWHSPSLLQVAPNVPGALGAAALSLRQAGARSSSETKTHVARMNRSYATAGSAR
jgi:hypothetical protein